MLMVRKYINSKQKILEIKYTSLCLGNISKDCTVDDIKKLDQMIFSISYNTTDVSNIVDIHKYLIKKHDT